MKLIRRTFIALLIVAAALVSLTFIPGSGPVLVRLAAAFGAPGLAIDFGKGSGNFWSPITVENLTVGGVAGDTRATIDKATLVLNPLGLFQWREQRWIDSIALHGVELPVHLRDDGDPFTHSLLLLLFQEETKRAPLWWTAWRADWFFDGELVPDSGATPARFVIDAPASGQGRLFAHADAPLALGTLNRDQSRFSFNGLSEGPADLLLHRLELLCDLETRQPRQIQLGLGTRSKAGSFRVDFTRTEKRHTLSATVFGERLDLRALDPDFVEPLGLTGGVLDFHASWIAHLGGRIENFAFDGSGRGLRGIGYEIGDVEFAGHANEDALHLRRLTLTQQGNRIEATATLPRQLSLARLAESDWELSGLVSLANPAALSRWTPIVDVVSLEQGGALHLDLHLGRTDGWAWGNASASGARLALAGMPFDELTAALSLDGNELHLQKLEASGAGDSVSAYAWVDLGGSGLFNAWIKADLTHLDTARALLPKLPWLGPVDAAGIRVEWHGDGTLASHSAAFSLQTNELQLGDAAHTYSNFTLAGTYSPERLVIRECLVATDDLWIHANGSFDAAALALEADLFDTSRKHLGSIRTTLAPSSQDYTRFLSRPAFDWERPFELEANLLGLPLESLTRFVPHLPSPGKGQLWGRFSWQGTLSAPTFRGRLVLPDFQPNEELGLPGPLYFETDAWIQEARLSVQAKGFLPEHNPSHAQLSIPWPRSDQAGPMAFQLDLDRIPLAAWENAGQWFGPIVFSDGLLSARLKGWSGTESNWSWDGSVTLRKAQGLVPDARLAFRDLDAGLQFLGDTLRIDNLQADVAGGRIDLAGTIRQWSRLAEQQLDLTFHTRDLSLGVPFETTLAEGHLSGHWSNARVEGRAMVDPGEFRWLGMRGIDQTGGTLELRQAERAVFPLITNHYRFDLLTGEADSDTQKLPPASEMPAHHWRIEGTGDQFQLMQVKPLEPAENGNP